MTFTRTAAPLLGLATLACLALAARPAAAQTTISFTSSGAFSNLGTSYSTQGFTFSSPDGLSVVSGSSGYGDGETSLASGVVNGTITLTPATSGQTFSLNSLDIGSVLNNASPGFYAANTVLTGTLLTGGTVSDMVTASGAAKTFKFTDLTGLTSLTLTGQATTTNSTSGYSFPAFDNFVLNAPAAAPSAAPEPSAVAGLGVAVLGLGGLLLRARRRRA